MKRASPFARVSIVAVVFSALSLAFGEAHAQVEPPRGVRLFADVGYRGEWVRGEVIGNTVYTDFSIRSIKVWPGYKAILSNNQGDEVEFAASDLNISSVHRFFRVEVATNLENPRGTYYGYALGTGEGFDLAYRRFYLREGVNTVPPAETGGSIQTVVTDPDYGYRRPGEWVVELFCNPTTTVHRRTNFGGSNGELVGGRTYTPSGSGQTRELPVARFRSMRLECGKRATITVRGVGPGVNVTHTFSKSIEDLSAAFANLPARQPVERYIQRVRIHN